MEHLSQGRRSHLRSLHLDGNLIGDQGVASLSRFRQLTELRELTLRGCGLTGDGLQSLCSLQALELESLNLGSNGVTQAKTTSAMESGTYQTSEDRG